MTGYRGLFLNGEIFCLLATLVDLDASLCGVVRTSPGQMVFIEGSRNWVSRGPLGELLV